MNPEYFETIARPKPSELQRLQCKSHETIGDRLSEQAIEGVPEHVHRRMTFGYYHDWERESPTILVLFSDPGIPSNYITEEAYAQLELGRDPEILDTIRTDQRFLARWLSQANYASFTQPFLDACRQHSLITDDRPWWRYVLSGAFFDDFYHTNACKYRGQTPTGTDLTAAFETQLKPEIEYVNPGMVFAFGGQAWRALCHLELTPIGDAPEPDSPGVIERHGSVYTINAPVDTKVIAAAHPSPRIRGPQISIDEYAGGVKRGIDIAVST